MVCSLLVLCLSPLSLNQLGLVRSRVLDHIGRFISRSARHVGQFLCSKVGGSSAKFRAEINVNLRGSSITSLSSTSIVICMLRFGTAIARLRAHQLDAYEG